MRTWRGLLRDVVPQRWRMGLIRTANRVSGNWLNRAIYGPVTYNQDGLATTHNADFMREPRFAAAYAAGEATGSWPFGDLHWRAHVICWAAQRGMALDGDFVECGVNRGGFALAAMRYTAFEQSSKRFFLLDTYDDIPEEQLSARERRDGIRRGAYASCYDDVLRTFAPYGAHAVVIRGRVPATLPQVTAEKIAFLSIDMNAREPEIAAAECFWDRMTSGAAMVLDDYGWRKHAEQRLAFDEFARARGVPLLALPTGQGLLLKP